MMMMLRPRQGIGLDIEYSEDIVHRVVHSDDSEAFYGFNGMIIKLPFFQIYFGDMFELEEE
jgi:hypothetical protein